MQPLYVCFYTARTGYEPDAMEMKRTLDAHFLPHDVRDVEVAGNWQRITQYKPVFIRDRMIENPGRSVIWIDADARVLRPPALMGDIGSDFAAIWRSADNMLAGFIYFAPTPAARKLLDEWIAENARVPNGKCGDQGNLQNVVTRMEGAGELTVTRLPLSYSAIFDAEMCDPAEVVILHTQASRRLKT